MSMFCFQCEQTANSKGCTVRGVCSKEDTVANAQDTIVSELIALAKGVGQSNKETDHLVVDALFATITNVNFELDKMDEYIDEIRAAKKCLGVNVEAQKSDLLFKGDEDTVSLRSTLLFGLKGMAAYCHHARVLGKEDPEVTKWFYKGLAALGQNHSVDEWLGLIMEFGKINLRCMEILDEANTSTYGTPEPTEVTTNIEKGPFIIVTGHDLHDLYMLLEQSKDSGVNIYTHGEMLPCHAYPKLKAFKHLKGNFGTAWQNQQHEFDNVPAPILYTTNCIMMPKASYKDRIFTTSVVGYKDTKHIYAKEDGSKDFSSIIEAAKKLGGYSEDKKMTGVNGGDKLMVGFGHGTVLGASDKIIAAVKDGTIKHFFLVGGCDGAKPGRNYYTDFVKNTPKDSVVLTLACGKYRFNDLNLGTVAGFPRIMDMGQCNDAYSAVQVAVALAKAFDTDVNKLPLTIVLSWYEQKAVCVLLTLLSLGIKNIHLGPTLPAFISPNVLKVLVEKFNITPTTTAKEDLAAALN